MYLHPSLFGIGLLERCSSVLDVLTNTIMTKYYDIRQNKQSELTLHRLTIHDNLIIYTLHEDY